MHHESSLFGEWGIYQLVASSCAVPGTPPHLCSPPQAYWLTCSLAAGGLLKARTFGLPYGSKLFRLGERTYKSRAVRSAGCSASVCTTVVSMRLARFRTPFLPTLSASPGIPLLHLCRCMPLAFKLPSQCPHFDASPLGPPAGNLLVNFTAVHEALGDSVADMLPVNVAVGSGWSCCSAPVQCAQP